MSLPKQQVPSGVFWSDQDYTLGTADGLPYLIAKGHRYRLTSSPYEPCLYITDEHGRMTAVHNSFCPDTVLECFANGLPVTSITGLNYSPQDFCRMIAYAAGRGDVQIDDAEHVFGDRSKNHSFPVSDLPSRFEHTPSDPFYTVLADYPDCVTDFCIVRDDLPYRSYPSHRRALEWACRKLLSDPEDGWLYDIDKAAGNPIPADELFAPALSHGLNYRTAFLHPPDGEQYTDADFERLNAALFPAGTENLEVCEWTTDWSDYFDESPDGQGALCLTVYDKALDRFVIILASAME